MLVDVKTEQPNTEKGGRKWMYPLIQKGRYYRYRTWLSYAYLVLFFAGPFLKIGGHPFLLLNVLERRFVIFGQVFWPQDFFLFVLAMLAGMICIVLFTIAFGRLFCGWICPQTIFMEMVFRKIEIRIEGDHKKRKKLDDGPMTTEKIWKKTLKHGLFILLSFLISNTFLAYIIGITQLMGIVTEPITQHWVGFASIWIFTATFYLVYSQVRELVCTVICPYGRLQGVFTDKHTLGIAYDYERGEPRGKLSRKAETAFGDCVDCGLCVAVCPTGIDIRNGSQMECVSCTACIDVCDHVMTKIHKPINLIGYFSEDMIKEKKRLVFTPRMYGYGSVIVILLSVLTFFVFQRGDVDVTIMRSAGMLYQEQKGGYISNIYNADLINKTDKPQSITLEIDDPAIKITYIQATGVLAKESSAKAVFFVLIPAANIHTAKTDLRIKVMQQNKVLSTIKTTFIGPVND